MDQKLAAPFWEHDQLNRDGTSGPYGSDKYVAASAGPALEVFAATSALAEDDFGPRHTDNIYDFRESGSGSTELLAGSAAVSLSDGDSHMDSAGSAPPVDSQVDEIVVMTPSVVEDVDDSYIAPVYDLAEGGVFEGDEVTTILGRKGKKDVIKITPASAAVPMSVDLNGTVHILENRDQERRPGGHPRVVVSGRGGDDTVTSRGISVTVITGDGNDTIDLGDPVAYLAHEVFSGAGEDKIRAPTMWGDKFIIDRVAPGAENIYIAKPGTPAASAADQAVTFFEDFNLQVEADVTRRTVAENSLIGLSNPDDGFGGGYSVGLVLLDETREGSMVSPEQLASSAVHEFHHSAHMGLVVNGVGDHPFDHAPLGGEIYANALGLVALSYFKGEELDIDQIVRKTASNLQGYPAHNTLSDSSLYPTIRPIVEEIVEGARPGVWSTEQRAARIRAALN